MGKEWLSLIYNNIRREITTDIFVFNEHEFKNQLSSNSFLQNIINSGKLVFEKI